MEVAENKNQAVAIYGRIRPSNLAKNQYTISLLQEALRNRLLSRQEIDSIEVQLMMILKDVIMRYTKGESSSVTNDTAESLLKSILYSIDAYALSCSSPEEAVEHLKKVPLKEIYARGLERVREWFEETKSLYDEVKRKKLDVKLESYNLTIRDIPIFLKNYGIVFGAHNAMASIDYQLVFDDMSVQGVLYMKNYLENLKIETEFCRNFREEDIEILLESFGRKINMDYKIELINIFELVFNNAVFNIMAGNMDKGLTIAECHFNRLNDELKSLSSPMISKCIDQAVDKLIGILNIDGPYLLSYIYLYKNTFLERVINAVENDCLGSIVIVGKEEHKAKSTILFDNNERMSDEKFKSAVKRLVRMKNASDKISFIKSNFSSLHDFMDVLNSDCIFGDEYDALFGALGDLELAILFKIVFYEELREGLENLPPIVDTDDERETEWHSQFIRYFKKIGRNRIELIKSLIDDIQYEEISFY